MTTTPDHDLDDLEGELPTDIDLHVDALRELARSATETPLAYAERLQRQTEAAHDAWERSWHCRRWRRRWAALRDRLTRIARS